MMIQVMAKLISVWVTLMLLTVGGGVGSLFGFIYYFSYVNKDSSKEDKIKLRSLKRTTITLFSLFTIFLILVCYFVE